MAEACSWNGLALVACDPWEAVLLYVSLLRFPAVRVSALFPSLRAPRSAPTRPTMTPKRPHCFRRECEYSTLGSERAIQFDKVGQAPLRGVTRPSRLNEDAAARSRARPQAEVTCGAVTRASTSHPDICTPRHEAPRSRPALALALAAPALAAPGYLPWGNEGDSLARGSQSCMCFEGTWRLRTGCAAP